MAGCLQCAGVSLVPLLALAAGCRSERITTSPVAISADADAWSGSRLTLRSSAFGGADSLPTVMTGSENLGVRSFGADSVSVQLPDTNGSLTLSTRLRSGAILPSISVRVHGFRAVGLGPRVDGYPFPWPLGGAPKALAFQDGRLVQLDYRFNTALPLTADTNLGSPCLIQPTPSLLELRLVVVVPHDSLADCTGVIAIPVAPGAPAADTGPVGGYSWLWAVQLGRGRWMLSLGHLGIDFRSSLPGDSQPLVCPYGMGIVMSPLGSRVAPLCAAPTPAGAPVVDAAAFRTAFTIPDVHWLLSAAFSDGDETLFAIGADSLSRTSLIAADARTGRVLGAVPMAVAFDEWWSNAIAVDPDGHWLYVMRFDENLLPYLDVFERSKLMHAASLRVPTWATSSLPGHAFGMAHWTLLLDPLARPLYATMDNDPMYPPGPALPTTVLTFDLMP
jgi:hypothetical protein